MSWNVTGTGTKAGLQKAIDGQFDSLIVSSKGTPNEAEYSAAKTALSAFVASAPDGHLLQIESWGSASYGADHPSLSVHLKLNLVAATLKE